MTDQNFLALTPRQRHVLVIAMQVRNALEDFHVEHLSDAQMKLLNQTIRYAIDDAIDMIENANSDPARQFGYGWLVQSIPSYWEIPGRDPRPVGEDPF